MFSYVYMKILESQPKRYDRGISWLSFGQAERVKRRIVEAYVRPGSRILDVGCGTGTLALLAAKRGAHVTGFDVSGGMLAVARGKVEAAGLSENVELHQMGVGGMDILPTDSFDLVTSTLVFSELSPDERRYTAGQAHRVLTPGGFMVIADEVRPAGICRRVLHVAVRLPLAAVTFAVTQTTTTPVEGLEDLVLEAGFRIESARRSQLGSFLCLVAAKEET